MFRPQLIEIDFKKRHVKKVTVFRENALGRLVVFKVDDGRSNTVKRLNARITQLNNKKAV
jgi:hypothetical protein